MKTLNFALIFIIFTSAAAWSQEAVKALYPIENLIPKAFNGKIAEDLIFNGKNLSPEELQTINTEEWNGKLDFSDLNPVEDRNYWSNSFPKASIEELNKEDETLGIENYASVSYESFHYSEDGQARFVVRTMVNGQPKFSIVSLGPLSYQENMRKTLLRKIGFKIPAMKRVKGLKIDFKNKEEKEAFLLNLSDKLPGEASSRWITFNPADNNSITVQDVDITSINDNGRRNLAIGPFAGEISVDYRNRRIFNSLVVAYNLVYFNKSVNIMPWIAGRVVSNNVELDFSFQTDYQHPGLFNCTYEDAQWITKRLNKLTKQDWFDVVNSSELPGPIVDLLLEKIVSRRNSNSQLFDVKAPILEVKPEISNGNDLVKGKLVTANFPGYAVDFIYGDPESPLSGSEKNALIWSQVIRYAISGAQSALNNLKFMSTDAAGKNQEAITKLLSEKAAEAKIKGAPQDIKFTQWSYPTFGGQLIFGRNIVAGTYQGTDNTLSQVDTLGISLKGGVFAGVFGLNNDKINGEGRIKLSPAEKGLRIGSVGGGAGVQVTRLYAHVTPITSIKKANKTSFKNIIIPYIKKQMGKTLNKYDYSDRAEMPENIREKISQEIKTFKENFSVGESLIITDSINASAGAQGTVTYQFMELQAGFSIGELVVSRTHITRRDENTIQIYKNFGSLFTPFDINVSLAAGVPVLRATANTKNGWARTHFYTINLNENDKNVAKSMIALRSLLSHGSLKKVKELNNPYIVEYEAKENQTGLGVLAFSFGKIKTATQMRVISPQGKKKEYYRKYNTYTDGTNTFEYGADAVSFLADKYLKFDPNLSNYSLNPGNTFSGKAFHRVVTLETEVKDKKDVEIFAKINRVYNGYRGSIKLVNKRIKRLQEHYHRDIFAPNLLANTQNIFLYRVGMAIHVHPAGIEQMLKLDERTLKHIFTAFNNSEPRSYNPTIKEDEEQNPDKGDWTSMLKLQKLYQKYANDISKKTEVIVRALKLAEGNLTLDGLKAIWGEANMYAYADIEGFRDGVEYNRNNLNELRLRSDSVGILGKYELFSGPLSILTLPQLNGGIGITEGELFASWLLKRVF